jgi:hypothetical protein
MEDDLKQTMESALRKLKAGMDEGPFGPDVTLTTSESCLLYRMLNERLGLRAPE